VALGRQALLGPGGGNGNVAVGYQTLGGLSTGHFNIGIGWTAGDGITTGIRNISIGYNSDISAGVSNAVAIGSDAIASQTDAIILGNSANENVKVGIGTNSPTEKLHVVGNVVVSGTVTATTLTQSDRRLKTQIASLPSPIEVLKKIEGVSYYWKSNDDRAKQYGVIAQEIEKVLPDIVKTNDAGFKAVNYTALIPFLVEAIKEQQKQIDELKKENTQLSTQLHTELAKLTSKLNQLGLDNSHQQKSASER
jgi:hypothetical protein